MNNASHPYATVFIVADEKKNAGERDYMKALSAQIKAQGLQNNTSYFVFKMSGGAENAEASILPLTDKEYASVPQMQGSAAYNDFLTQMAGKSHVDIVAVGNSMLDATLALDSELQRQRVSGASMVYYITHMVNDKADLQKIVDCKITVCAPIGVDALAAIDIALAMEVDLVTTEAVPHTNSRAACLIDQRIFMETANGKALQKDMDAGKKFAFAVVNAGFGVGEDKKHVPYTEDEAFEHGIALGAQMEAGTSLVLAHGGPRNIMDEELGEDTMQAFKAGYLFAQKTKGAEPAVYEERYIKDASYNAIKAGYILAGHESCAAFISNAEGYGTMDAAALHVNNQRVLLGMFPFEAIYADPTGQRQANVEKYQKLGIAVLEPRNGTLSINRHAEERKTPVRIRDAAEHIANVACLAKPAVIGAPKLPSLTL